MSRLGLIALIAIGCEDSDPNVTCGTGTVLIDGQCRPDGTPFGCAKGTVEQNGQCVPSADACGNGTVLDATGVCVSEGAVTCGAGTIASGGECVPDPTQICREGTTYDPAMGGCVPNVRCPAGEVIVDGLCLSAEELVASMADVLESEPDDNDPAFGGTPESLPTPEVGDTTIFAGTIGDPTDLDGDFDLDQDWDYWSFTASSGDIFEIVLRSLGSSELGFVVRGPNGYRRLSPLYFESEPSRHVVLPYDGTYTIAIAPQHAIEGAIDAGPAGGIEHRYVVALEKEALERSELPLGGSATGSLLDVSDNVHWIQAPAGTLLRVEVEQRGRDGSPILMTFDSNERFIAELPIPQHGLVHRTEAADDLVLLIDWTRLVGEDDEYSIRTVEIAPNDAGTIAPDTTVASSTISIAAGASGYFVAEVSAGQIVELAISGGADAPDVRVFAPDGEMLSHSFDARAARFHATAAGRYTIEVHNSGIAAGDFGVVFESITPVIAGPLAPNAVTATVAAWLPNVPASESAYFVVRAGAPAELSVAAMQATLVNLSLAIFDARFGLLRELPLGGTAPALSAFLPNAGEAIVVVTNSGMVSASGISIDASVSDLPPLEREPNDSLELATELVLGDPLFGEIDGDDDDYFRITLLAPLAADELLEVRAVEANTDTYSCQLRDSRGAIIEEQTPRNLGCVVIAADLGAGDYYFSMQKSEATLRVYQIVAEIVPGVRESEPNDDPPGNQIVDISGEVPSYGELALSADVDIFNFVLPTALGPTDLVIVRAEMVGTNPTMTVQATWTGPSVNTTVDVAPTGTAIRNALPSGAYRVRMTRNSENVLFDGHYRLTISTASVSVTDAEPNDNPGTAQPLGPLPGSAIGLLTAPTTDDDDFYSVQLPQNLAADRALVIELHKIGPQPSDTLRISLLDGNQTFLTSSSSGDPRRITRFGASAGTYYVRVDSPFLTTFDTDYLLVVRVE